MASSAKIFQSTPDFPTDRQLDHRDFKETRKSYWQTDGKGGRVTFRCDGEKAMDWDAVFGARKRISEDE